MTAINRGDGWRYGGQGIHLGGERVQVYAGDEYHGQEKGR